MTSDPATAVCDHCPHPLNEHYENGCGWCICKTAGTATDADLAAFLRDPTTASGLLPQWVRDGLATELENAQRSAERLRRLAGITPDSARTVRREQ